MANILISGDTKSATPVKVIENMPLVVSSQDAEVLAYLDWDMKWYCKEENKEKVKAIFKELKAEVVK